MIRQASSLPAALIFRALEPSCLVHVCNWFDQALNGLSAVDDPKLMSAADLELQANAVSLRDEFAVHQFDFDRLRDVIIDEFVSVNKLHGIDVKRNVIAELRAIWEYETFDLSRVMEFIGNYLRHA